MSGKRYNALDSFRGLLIINMVAYHALYDVVHIMNVPLSWYTNWQGYLWQQSICWGFIFLSGFCSRLSRHPLRHGLVVLGAGVLVSVITYVFMPSEFILYGVLYLLGLAALIQWGVLRLWSRLRLKPLPAWLGLVLSAAAFLLTRGVPRGYLGFESWELLRLPAWLYRWDWLAVVGFPGPGFRSSDYFPVVPWVFLYLCGYFLWRMVEHNWKIMDKLKPGLAPLAFLGRHSLVIYLLHQPVIMAVFMGIQALGWPK